MVESLWSASADPLNFIPDKIPKSIEGAKVYHHKADWETKRGVLVVHVGMFSAS